MKKVLCLIITLTMVLTAFAACSKPTNVDDEATTRQGQPVSNAKVDTEGLMTAEEVIDDASTVDFNLRMEVEGLKKVEEKDDESATSTISYYDRNGKIIYKKYVGYGEDSFDFYTKSKSGKDLTVKYIDEDGKTDSINVTCTDYSISFGDIDSAEKYGADDVDIVVQKTAENDFPKTAEYEYEDGKFKLTGNMFYADDGYHRYSCSYDDGNPTESDIVLYEKADSVKTNDDLYEMANDHRVKSAEFVEGQHKIEYTKDTNGKKTWFLCADIYFVFNNQTGAEQFADKYGLTAQLSQYGDRFYTCTLAQTAVPVDGTFSEFFDFAQQDFNDYSFGKLHLTDSGAIADITENDANLIFY